MLRFSVFVVTPEISYCGPKSTLFVGVGGWKLRTLFPLKRIRGKELVSMRQWILRLGEENFYT